MRNDDIEYGVLYAWDQGVYLGHVPVKRTSITAMRTYAETHRKMGELNDEEWRDWHRVLHRHEQDLYRQGKRVVLVQPCTEDGLPTYIDNPFNGYKLVQVRAITSEWEVFANRKALRTLDRTTEREVRRYRRDLIIQARADITETLGEVVEWKDTPGSELPDPIVPMLDYEKWVGREVPDAEVITRGTAIEKATRAHEHECHALWRALTEAGVEPGIVV